MKGTEIVRTHVKRYGNAKFGESIKWAAVVIREFWSSIDALNYPGLERRMFERMDMEANFDSKRAAEAWASKRAAEIRGL